MRTFTRSLRIALASGVTILLISPASFRAQAAVTLMANAGDVPKYYQVNDYSALMNPRLTDLSLPGQLRYQDLPTASLGTMNVQVTPDLTPTTDWHVGDNPPPMGTRTFTANDLNDITKGTYHCAPTAGAMMLQFWSTRPMLGPVGIGAATVTSYVDEIGGFMDTNDQNTTINSGENGGHFSTIVKDNLAGIENFAKNRDPKIVANTSLHKFEAADAAMNPGLDRYKAAIDADRPIMVGFLIPNGIGHAVVGIGYETDDDGKITKLIVRDPNVANGTPQTSMNVPVGGLPIGAILTKKMGGRTNSEGDIFIPTSDDSLLENGVAFDLEFYAVPEPSAMCIAVIAFMWLLVRTRGNR